MPQLTNLTSHLFQNLDYDPQSHQLADVINRLVIASKMLSRDINKAGLADILGEAGSQNTTGDDQVKLDVHADELMIELLKQSPYVAAVATEESEDFITFNDDFHSSAEYIVYIDPVDGSSNVDVNVSVGTNFLIYRRVSEVGSSLTDQDYFQLGKNAVSAGYIVYGSSTMLVYSTGQGVHGLTLDPEIGEFLLTHPNMKFPEKCGIYSVNEAYYSRWSPEMQQFVDKLKTTPGITARYIGSLVADFHRNLLKGGIYLYPADSKKPEGKLRMMYEAIPFAYLAEQAGGYASDGTQSILEMAPTELHQRTPLFVGNEEITRSVEEI